MTMCFAGMFVRLAFAVTHKTSGMYWKRWPGGGAAHVAKWRRIIRHCIVPHRIQNSYLKDTQSIRCSYLIAFYVSLCAQWSPVWISIYTYILNSRHTQVHGHPSQPQMSRIVVMAREITNKLSTYHRHSLQANVYQVYITVSPCITYS